MPRYGFSGIDDNARNMLDRMHIPVQQRGTMWDIDMFGSKVIQVPNEDDRRFIRYYYLLEGAPFYMDISEGILHVVPEDEREYWVNRFKEEEDNFFGKRPPF